MDLLLELLTLVVALVGVFALAGLVVWSMTTIRYHLDPRQLRITFLGLSVRRIPLHEIKSIGHRPVLWGEFWANTLRGGTRRLVIRRSNGLFKNIVITPKNHLVFKAELERARRAEQPAPAALVEPAHH